MQHSATAMLHAGVRIAAAQAIELLQHGGWARVVTALLRGTWHATHATLQLLCSRKHLSTDNSSLQTLPLAPTLSCLHTSTKRRKGTPMRQGGLPTCWAGTSRQTAPTTSSSILQCQPAGMAGEDDTRLWSLGSSTKRSGLPMALLQLVAAGAHAHQAQRPTFGRTYATPNLPAPGCLWVQQHARQSRYRAGFRAVAAHQLPDRQECFGANVGTLPATGGSA